MENEAKNCNRFGNYSWGNEFIIFDDRVGQKITKPTIIIFAVINLNQPNEFGN